ncbi:MAG: hypothetical protein ACTSVZ_04570 [Promethearchaeota archaeon]
MVSILLQVIQIITLIWTIFLVGLSLYRNPRYRGNQLFALSLIFFEIFVLCFVIYYSSLDENVVKLTLRIAIFVMILGTYLFVLAIQIFVKSDAFISHTVAMISGLITLLILLTVALLPDLVTVISLNPTVTQRNLLVTILCIVWLFILTVYNLYTLAGMLRSITEDPMDFKKKLKILFVGQILLFIIPVLCVLSGLMALSGLYLGAEIFSIVQYLSQFVAFGVLGFAFLRKKNNSNSETPTQTPTQSEDANS